VTTVVIAPTNVVNFPAGGGHFWVYMQYVDGLRRLGCDVYWLEEYSPPATPAEETRLLDTFAGRMARYGLAGKAIVYSRQARAGGGTGVEYVGTSAEEAEAVFRRADLLLNFHYTIEPSLLERFRRTALVDIDPGLLQFWLANGQISLPAHDVYFTTGKTVGTPEASFPDGGLPWIHVPPPVSLDLWPYDEGPSRDVFTTVSTWWGDEWVSDGVATYENNKRVSFLEFAALPRVSGRRLELALYLGRGDAADRETLEGHGWRVRHSLAVARTPEMYARYIRGSRGEFSCAKPSCLRFRNAWVSDRSLCYLATGRPVVVQDTGQSEFLPGGEGMFFFSTLEEAAEALAAADTDYERQRRRARELAEAYFDAKGVAEAILTGAERG
jgi:hypothetical protein